LRTTKSGSSNTCAAPRRRPSARGRRAPFECPRVVPSVGSAVGDIGHALAGCSRALDAWIWPSLRLRARVGDGSPRCCSCSEWSPAARSPPRAGSSATSSAPWSGATPPVAGRGLRSSWSVRAGSRGNGSLRRSGRRTGFGIVITDGDNGIENLLDRTLPGVPRQHCTFHIHHNMRLRLWQGVSRSRTATCWPTVLAPIPAAPTRTASLQALEESITLAEDHDFTYVAQHLRHVGPAAVDMEGRAPLPKALADGGPDPSRPHNQLAGTDHAGDQPSGRSPRQPVARPGVRSMVNLILARRFHHPAWRALRQDAGTVKAWAGLRGQRNDPRIDASAGDPLAGGRRRESTGSLAAGPERLSRDGHVYAAGQRGANGPRDSRKRPLTW
jgi:hypothetical protein